MVKKLEDFLSNYEETLRINPFCTIMKEKKIGEDCYTFYAVFNVHPDFSSFCTIFSRNPKKILNELAIAQKSSFLIAAEQLNNDLWKEI